MEEKKKFYKSWWFTLLLIVIYTVAIVLVTSLVTINITKEKTIETVTSQSKEENKTKGEKTKEQEKQLKEISLKEKITEKDWEVTIQETGFKQDIIPSNPNSYYTHYQVKDTNNTYFYVVIEAKNISALGLRADSVAKVKMKYDDKYEYTTFSTIEETGGGTFTYTNITNIDPLTTRKLYYLVEVPKTIAEDGKTMNTEITVNDNTYKLIIR